MKWRYLLCLPELILLFFFVAPIGKRICNLGNLAGILVCLLLLIVTLIPHKIFALLRWLWSYTVGKMGLSLVAILIVTAVVFCGVMSVQMVRAIYCQPDTPQIVVVLGCKVKGTTPSLMLIRRLETAKQYLTAHPEVQCIVTGGQGSGEDIPEGQAMQTWLVEHGISSDRVLVEDRSRDTQENLRNAAAILAENDLPPEIVLVTDGFHTYRAQLLAKKEGLTAYTYPAKTRPLFVPTYWVREWMALFQLYVFGHG